MTANVTDPASAVFMYSGATACAMCWAPPTAGNQSSQDSNCVNGTCGYADLDSDSSTACASCVVGTMVDRNGMTQCTDFDECASNPCENGGSCSNVVLRHPAYLPPNPTFRCDCTHNGFTGERCQLCAFLFTPRSCHNLCCNACGCSAVWTSAH
jgi:hypothetical protein